MAKKLAVTLTAHPGDQREALDAAEAFGRVATGLALDGIYVSISYTTFETEEEEENP